jgi:hypothetical protein
MRGTDRPAGILVLMLIACPASGAFGADLSTLGLPDVSVTAPPITPPWKKFSPYLGNTRVEEDKMAEHSVRRLADRLRRRRQLQARAIVRSGGAWYAAGGLVDPNLQLPDRP